MNATWSDDHLELRPFDSGDRTALIALWRECDLVVPWNDPDRDIDRKLAIDPAGLVVAVIGGAIGGSAMAGYDGHRGWINYLAVAPRYRGRGLGRRLIEHAERLLGERGCPKINIQVRADNAEVIAFYESLGYRTETVVNMGKRLMEDE